MKEKRISILNDALAKYLIANEKVKPLFLRIFSELSSFSYEELENAHMQLGELPKKNKNQKKQVLDALFRVEKGKYLIVEINGSKCDNEQFGKNGSYTMAFRNKLRRTNEEEPIVELINIDSKNFYGTKTGIIKFAIRDLESRNLKECEPELYFSTHFAVDNNTTLRYNENEDLIQLGKAIRAKNMKELRKVCMEGGEEWMAVYLETENFIEDEEHMEEYNLADVYEQEMNDATRTGRKEGHKEERTSLIKMMHTQGYSLEDTLKLMPQSKEEVKRIYYSV